MTDMPDKDTVQHLREFPDPPNLDAHEGVKMMFGTMDEAGLYPPQLLTRPSNEREAVVLRLGNQNQPSAWEQVNHFLGEHGSIGNADLRQILETDDPIRASRQLREWIDCGLLTVANPESAKRLRRYKKAGYGTRHRFLYYPGKQISRSKSITLLVVHSYELPHYQSDPF